MLKVLFTHSYFLRFDPKQWKQQQPYPPLATLFAAAALRAKGCEVALFDTMFEKSPAKLAERIDSFRPDVVVIYDDGFNYLTKMCLTNMREAAFSMCSIARQRGCKVVVSSSDATDHSEKYLDHGAGFVIIGEGEATLYELINSMEKKVEDFEGINGLVYRKHDITVKTKKRDVLRELDSLAPPAWDLVNMEAYRKRWIKSSGYFSLNISTTRGCPFHCNWCAKPIYGNRYHAHSPAYVVKELKKLVNEFGADHIWMTDDIFGLKPGWVNEFSGLVQKEKFKFRYKIQSRVDLLLQENNIEALAASGCDAVWVGAESGSQKILDAMEKGTQVSQIYDATRLLKKHGIKPAFFLQFGYPGETQEDIQATLTMVSELMPEDIGVSVSYPLPGTKFYERVKNDLKEKANWADSDELALMFQSTFPSAFYKELQRYIHKQYRVKQGMKDLKQIFSNPVSLSFHKLSRIARMPYHLTGAWIYQGRLKKTVSIDPIAFQK